MNYGPRTKKQLEAVKRNFAKEKQRISEGKAKPHNLKHGTRPRHGGSLYVQKRYSNKRTREGKKLAQFLKQVCIDLSIKCPSAVQQVLLASIRSKVIAVWEISKYLDEQETFISREDQRLIPVLRADFLKYSDSLNKDLKELAETAKVQKDLSLEGYLEAEYGHNNNAK